MNDEEFTKIKKETLPLDLQEHFAKNRDVFDRNIEKFETVMEAVQKSEMHSEMKVTVDYLLDSLLNSQRTASVLFDHNEMTYFFCFLLRKQIDHIERTLNDHGIIIDRISGYELGLRFVDEYIKHSSGDKEI